MTDNSETNEWRYIGETEKLKVKRCQQLFAEIGKAGDLVLVYFNETFHAMEAWCGHLGGPLYNGDIEDYKGKPHLICPWHGYPFELSTGKSDIGIMQEKFETKTEQGKVYVKYKCDLSTDQSNVRQT